VVSFLFGVRWRGYATVMLVALAMAASCGRAAESPRHDQSSAGHAGEQFDAGAGSGALRGAVDGLVADSTLGQSCRDDQDCGSSGLYCLGPEQDYQDGAGAPAGGLCTFDCAEDLDCQPFGAGAVCATLAEVPLTLQFATKVVPRVCLLGCSLGSPGGSKCRGRADLACRPFAPHGVLQCKAKDPEDSADPEPKCPEGGLCFRDQCRELACGPRCNDDADCSGERRCNAVSGLCDERVVEAPIGKLCHPDIPELTDCGGGICHNLFEDDVHVKGFCTQSCTLGQRCGNGQGACMMPRFSDYAVGDIAYCLELCDGDADCSHPDDVCHPFEDSELERQYGGLGVCDLNH
jgi:hypothetical protein